MPKTAALCAAVFQLSAKNLREVFKHPPAWRGLNYNFSPKPEMHNTFEMLKMGATAWTIRELICMTLAFCDGASVQLSEALFIMNPFYSF